MSTLLSIFAAHDHLAANDRVLITKGPFHGFSATVMNVPEPGKISLAIDGCRDPVIATDDSVKLCKSRQSQFCAVPRPVTASAASSPVDTQTLRRARWR